MLRFPPRKILVPFDLTDVSVDAWRLARAWAKRFGAVVELLYVEELLPPVTWEFTQIPLTGGMKRKIVAHIRRKVGAEPRVSVVEGDAPRVILHRIKALRPDLVVMGTHARRGLEHAWVGSVAETITRLSPAPVLIVREGAAAAAPRHVLAPVNFTDYSEFGFVFAAGVAAAFRAALTALHVAAPGRAGNPEFRLQNLLARVPKAARERSRPGWKVRRGEPLSEILKEAKRCDLIALSAHRQGTLKELLIGNTAERLLRESPVPVLAVPAPAGSLRWEKWLSAVEARPPLA